MVSIKVKVAHQAREVLRFEFTVAVFALELSKRLCVDKSRVTPINPFEGGVGFEITHRAENLPELLNRYLLLGCENQKLLYFKF